MNKKITLILSLLLSFGAMSNAMASHFRGGQISWTKVSGNTIEFEVVSSWRSGFIGSSNTFRFGDGQSSNSSKITLATNIDLSGNSYTTVKNVYTHTYSTAGTYTAYFTTCCRISGLSNIGQSQFYISAEVGVGGAQTGSTKTSLPAILQLIKGVNNIPLAVVDPDGGTVSCSIAPANASNGTPSAPTTTSGTLTVSSDCILSWDASSALDKSRYAIQIFYEEGGLKTAHDFIIEINGNLTNAVPVCSITSGIANTSITVGDTATVSVTATDPDGGNLVLTTASGLPVNATITPTLGLQGAIGASPMTATISWTPSTATTAAASLIFTDSNNASCQQALTFDSINVVAINTPPTADAGADANINEADSHTLNGSGSSDADGMVDTYLWTQVAGPIGTFTGANTVSPVYTAPFITGNQTATFSLVVFDDEGLQSLNTDSVDIMVVENDAPPIADAGDDTNIKEGATLILDGSSSFDNETDPLTDFEWVRVGGNANAITLVGALTANPSFVAPLGVGTTVILQLTVNDGLQDSAVSPLPDTNIDGDDLVTIEISENNPPIADAGPDQTVNEETNLVATVVTLDGSASSDPDGDVFTYAWTAPPGTTLSCTTCAQPTFDAPAVSVLTPLTFSLIVTDTDPVNPKSSVADEVTINITNSNLPPQCELGSADPDALWPPNHKMKAVAIIGVTDPMNDSVTLEINSITQDEAINGLGDGDSAPDASIVSGNMFDSALIRAERSGNEDGRVYTINFTADDGFESCTGSVTVGVPHSRKSTPVDTTSVTVDSTVAP